MAVVNYPAGFSPYGGLSVIPSADGSLFCGMIGNRAGRPADTSFLYWVWRVSPQGQAQFIELPSLFHHGELNIVGGRLIAAGFWKPGRDFTLQYEVVPGYVPFGEGASAAPVLLPSTLPAIDTAARGAAEAAVTTAKTAKTRADDLKKQLDHHLQNHPSAAPAPAAVDWPRVERIAQDFAWSKAGDRLYAEVQAAMTDKSHYLYALALRVVAAELSQLPQDDEAPAVDETALVEKVVAALVARLAS